MNDQAAACIEIAGGKLLPEFSLKFNSVRHINLAPDKQIISNLANPSFLR